MPRALTAVAFLALGFLGRNLYEHLRGVRHRKEQRQALETWEGEGGAVPVSPSRTAAQVPPVQPPAVAPVENKASAAQSVSH